jgi:hypothetical protein
LREERTETKDEAERVEGTKRRELGRESKTGERAEK